MGEETAPQVCEFTPLGQEVTQEKIFKTIAHLRQVLNQLDGELQFYGHYIQPKYDYDDYALYRIEGIENSLEQIETDLTFFPAKLGEEEEE